MAMATKVLGSSFIVAIAMFSASSAASAQTDAIDCAGVPATISEVVPGTWESPVVVIQGTEGPDVIVVEATGPTHVDGLGGNDRICIGGGMTVTGGEGDDTIFTTGPPIEARFVILGGAGDDEIHGGDNGSWDDEGYYVEILAGEEGNDTIYGNGGNDYLLGMDGDDTIYGNAGIDTIYGGGGADTVFGGWGADALFGGDPPPEMEPDAVSSTADTADMIFGGPGDDYLAGMLGADQLYGGDGDDVLLANLHQALDDLAAITQPESRDMFGSRMFGGAGNDLVVGSNRWDRMQGGPGNDTLWGFEGRDYIRGGPGDDQIVGGGGIDNVNGNTGNDHLIYQGADELHGGWGIDLCEAEVWPATASIQSCEQSGAPTLRYSPPASYDEFADR